MNMSQKDHRNPTHIDIQMTMRKIRMMRDNALHIDNSIIGEYSAWCQYFLNSAAYSISGLHNVNMLIESELPKHIDLDIFMLHFDRAKKIYLENQAILEALRS